MEYVPGENLAEAVKAGPLPPVEACRAARDAALGLAHAHAAGYVHRDVKPSNLIRTPEGFTKVLDFGLVTADVEGAGPLSGVNMVIGTPDYIAPEQIADPQAADARSDIYSLGCTLYHLLSGSAPYPVSSPIRKLDAHRDPAVLPAPLTGVPPALAMVVAKMLARNPADRFQTAMDVAAALEPFLSGVESGPRSAEPKATVTPRRLTTRWLVTVGLLVAVVGLLAGVVYKIQRDSEVIAVETDDPDIEVVMKRNGELIRIVDTKTKEVWELDTKKLRLRSDGSEMSIDLPGREPLIIRRNGDAAVTIRRQPAALDKPSSPAEKLEQIRVFPGTTETVLAVAVSPDGRWAAGGGGKHHNTECNEIAEGKDFSVRVWDRATGAVRHRLVGHAGVVTRVAFSPDSSRLASCDIATGIRIWDLKTGKSIHTVTAAKTRFFSVAFSPDGKLLAAAGYNSPVRIWNAETGELIRIFEDFPQATNAWHQAVFSPDGKRVAAVGWEAFVIYDAATGKILRRIEQPKWFRVVFVNYSRDGKRLLTSGRPENNPGAFRVQIWDAETGREMSRFPGRAPAFQSADGGRVLIGDDGGRALVLWDVSSRTELARGLGHTDATFSMAITQDGRYAVSGGNDNTARLWRLPEPRVARPLLAPSPVVEAKLPLKDGECHVFRGHRDGLLALAVSPDGKYAVTGGSFPENKDGALLMWDLHTGKEVKRFHGHDHSKVKTVYNVAFSPDGKKLLSASADGTARLWDVERGIEKAWLGVVRPDYWVFAVAFTPDGKQAVVGSERPRLFDLESNKDLERFEKYRVGSLRAAALSPDGTTLATGDSNGDGVYEVVSLWDMKSGKRVRSLAEHKWMVYAVAWSADGKRLASASHDGTVRVWDPQTGRGVQRLEHPRPVFGVAYSPGGRFLLTGSQDHAVRVWDARTGKEQKKFLHDLEVWNVAFTPDGKHALSVSQDKTMRMWKLPENLVDPRK
jgi:WD40 repeat protein